HTRNADALAFQARAEGKALGALAAEGSLAIGTQQRLRASGSVERFNLAALGDFPASELNARFETDGVVAPAPDAGFAITIGPSRLRGYPLSGNARGRLREKSIEDLELALAAGGNSLTATGRVNTQDNRFAWKIDAPNLAQLGRDFSGRVKGEGMLSGPTAALAIDVNLDARELRAPGGIALESMVLRGQARLAQDAPFRLSAIVTRGEVTRLPTRPILDALKVQAVGSTLVVSGRWDLTMRDTLNGKLALSRDSGDLVVAAETPLTLGVRELAAAVELQGGRAHAQAKLNGTLPGTITGTLDTSLVRSSEGRWQLPGTSPIKGSLSASMPSLKWLAALLNDSLALDGKLDAQLSAAGTIAEPSLSGQVQGRNLTVIVLDQGVNLRDGQLDAELSGRDVVLKRLRFSAGDGNVTASGRASYASDAPSAGIEWQATKLEVVKRPDRHIVVSGSGNVDLREKRIAARGKLTMDEGLVEIPESEGIVTSDDVVVVGRSAKPPGESTALPLTLDLEADLGDRFKLRGKGLDTQL